MRKPVIGFIAGANDPSAGDKAERKIAVMEDCGIAVMRDLAQVGQLVRSVLYGASFWMLQ